MVIPNLVFLMTMMMTMMMVAGMMIMLMMMMMMVVAGNFCQVVWAGTSSLGIGCARSPKTGKVVNSYLIVII